MGLKQQILDVLDDAEDALTMDQLMERIPVSKRLAHSVSSALCKLRANDEVFVGRTTSSSHVGPLCVYKYARSLPQLSKELYGNR